MARPRLDRGTYGKINIDPIKRVVEKVNGKKKYRIQVTTPEEATAYRARTYYRFNSGKLKQVERFADSAAKASRELKTALTTIDNNSGGTFKPSMKLKDLGERFLKDRETSGKTQSTIEKYEYAVRVHMNSDSGIGELTIAEATPEVLQHYLNTVYEARGAGAAKNSRSVLSGMFGLAVRNGAINRNPIRELQRIERKTINSSEAIPLKDLPRFIAALRADTYLQELDTVELFEYMLGTGWRVSEVCGLTWQEIDFEAGTASVKNIAVRVRGEGMTLQPFGKTESATRTINLPASLLEMLKKRIKTLPENEHNLVFPTNLGRIRDPGNTNRQLRDRRGALGFPNITTHSFRKTVVTLLDKAGMSARDIAEYVGHANPSLTQDVYMAKNQGSEKAAQALESAINSWK